jgi:hypothetical protein
MPGTSPLGGLRRGEIAGLRWGDVDLGRRTVQIGKTRVDVGDRAFDQDDPKTDSAGRVLPLPDALVSELAAAKARQLLRSSRWARHTRAWATWSVTRPASSTTPRRCPPCGTRPSRISTCHRSDCMTRAIPVHAHAPAGCADRVGCGLARPCRRVVHSSDLRTCAARGAGSRCAQLCSTGIKRRRLTGSHTRAVTSFSSL